MALFNFAFASDIDLNLQRSGAFPLQLPKGDLSNLKIKVALHG
jgi:hypothetical protein